MLNHIQRQLEAQSETNPSGSFRESVKRLKKERKKPQTSPNCGGRPPASTGWGGKKRQNRDETLQGCFCDKTTDNWFAEYYFKQNLQKTIVFVSVWTGPQAESHPGSAWHGLRPVHSHSPITRGPTCPATQCQIPHGWATWPGRCWNTCLAGLQEPEEGRGWWGTNSNHHADTHWKQTAGEPVRRVRITQGWKEKRKNIEGK